MSIMNTIGFSLGVLLFISSPVWAIYKWTDKNNVTHYGQFPPKGKKAQEIEVEAEAENPRTLNTLEKRTHTRKKPAQNQSTENKEKKPSADINSTTQNNDCAKAKQNLHILSNNKRIKIQDNGVYQILSENERQQQINGLNDLINVTCQGRRPKQQQQQ